MRLAVLGILLLAVAPSVDSKKKRSRTQFEIDFLEQHNKFRAMHKVSALKWSTKLAKMAQEWAEHLAKIDRSEHRKNNEYGENIFWAKNMKVDNKFPVISWYDEIKLYDFTSGDEQPKTLHFTQIVWKDTKRMGAGIAKAGNKIWVVANYDPAGNYEGEYMDNVFPPRK